MLCAIDERGDILNRDPAVEEVDIMSDLARLKVNSINCSTDGNNGHVPAFLIDERRNAGQCSK